MMSKKISFIVDTDGVILTKKYKSSIKVDHKAMGQYLINYEDMNFTEIPRIFLQPYKTHGHIYVESASEKQALINFYLDIRIDETAYENISTPLYNTMFSIKIEGD